MSHDILIDYMRRKKIAMTAENYIELNTLGDAHTVDELEGENLVEVLDLLEEGVLKAVVGGITQRIKSRGSDERSH